MPQRATWKKPEKLKSRKRIERVFREGKSFSIFPYKVVFLVSPAVQAVAGRSVAGGLLMGGSLAGRPIGGGKTVDGFASGRPVTGSGPAEETHGPGKLAAGGGKAVEAPGSGNAAKSRTAAVQAGFGAASRNFKKAVDRNRIKRLSREAYRLQKGPLLEQLARKKLTMAVFFVFIGKELPDYQTVSTKIGVALQKLLKETA